MKFYGENNFDLLREKFDVHLQDAALTAKLENLFTPKPYSLRWAVANISAQMLGFVCNIVSVLTAFSLFSYALFLSFVPALGGFLGWGTAFLLSIILCFVIEIFKRYSTNHFLQAAIQYKKFDKSLFCLSVVCCGLSVGTSFWGARWIPSSISQAPIFESPKLENLDSINTFFAAQIAATQTELEQTRKESTKPTGILSSTARPLIAALQKQKTTLQNSQQAELSAARQRNEQTTALAHQNYEKILDSYTKSTQENTDLLGWVTLILEGVYLACLLFSWLFYWNCYKERCALAQQKPTTLQEEKNETNENRLTKIVVETLANEPEKEQKTETTTSEKRPIGFFQDFQTNEKETIIVVKKSNENRKLPICLHCGTAFLPNHHKQKYCETPCRVAAWEKRTGRRFRGK